MPEDKPIPEFHVGPCQCNDPACTRMLFTMVNPVIMPSNEGLVPCVHFPMENAQQLVDLIRALCMRKGVPVK